MWLLSLFLTALSVVPQLISAQNVCYAFLDSILDQDDGSLVFVIYSPPDEAGNYCDGELTAGGSVKASFIIIPNGGDEPTAFYYTLPADQVPQGSVEWRVRTSGGDSNYIIFPPFNPNPPPYECEVRITGTYTTPGDDLGGYINLEGFSPAGCNPLSLSITSLDEGNDASETATVLASRAETWTYTSIANFSPGRYQILVTASAPQDPDYLPGGLEEPFLYIIEPQERSCTSVPEIIDSDCRQGYPSFLAMTIAVTTGTKECAISVTKNGDYLYTFVFTPDSEGFQQIAIPSEYMGSTIASYSVFNYLGSAPRDVVCPYERLPVECEISVSAVRSVKGPDGGFFASVEGSIQAGCGPLNFYIEGDQDSDFGEADDFTFRSTKELPAGSYRITLSNNPADPSEYLPAEIVYFSFTLGGPEPSLRRRVSPVKTAVSRRLVQK